jgi:hypothetical protein
MVTATGPERVTPLLEDHFAVNTAGVLTPTVAASHELRLARLGGFCVKPDRYDVGLDLIHGVATGSVNLWIQVPENPLKAVPFSFTLTTTGALSGQLLAPVTFELGKYFTIKVSKATIGNDGIITKVANLGIDAVLGGSGVEVPDGAFRLTADAGLATTIPILLPNIKFGNPQPGQGVGGFGLEGVRATLTFGDGTYRFTGSGTLTLPGVASGGGCKIGVSLQLTSQPPPIRQASLSVSGGCVKIPVGTTGAFITGFSGTVTANETDLAIDIGLNFEWGENVPNLGALLNGTIGAHWDSSWSVGLNGTLKAFRWDAGNASLTLGPRDGLRGSLTLRIALVIEGNGRIHAWRDGAGFHLTGHADTTLVVRAGGLIRECQTVGVQICLVIPPVDQVGPSENADFGEFRLPVGARRTG